MDAEQEHAALQDRLVRALAYVEGLDLLKHKLPGRAQVVPVETAVPEVTRPETFSFTSHN